MDQGSHQANGPSSKIKPVCYVWSRELISECDRIPVVIGRASMVHELINSYGLLNQLSVVRARPATEAELREFHAESYVQHLKNMPPVSEDYEVDEEDEEVGIGYDCTPVENMYGLVCAVAGGTVTAALALLNGARVAINWCGGRHHAQRFEAEGFCYVNDIVIGIEKLRKKFPKVLYIDLDVHHGNGVEEAYAVSKNVLTLSLHKREPGFYPGSGAVEHVGAAAARGYAVNVPYRDGLGDDNFEYLFHKALALVLAHFRPDALVIQCGADVLAGDPLGGANVTPDAVCRCVSTALDLGRPTMLLGGGGYNVANAARLWTRVTAGALDVRLGSDIPDTDPYFTSYGPGYDLTITPTNRKDFNNTHDIDLLIATLSKNLQKYIPINTSTTNGR